MQMKLDGSMSKTLVCNRSIPEGWFEVHNDGIIYTPYTGNGEEKDLDHFISWEDLKFIFIEDRENLKTRFSKKSPNAD